VKKKYIDLPPDNPAVGDLLVASKNGTLSFKFTFTTLFDLLRASVTWVLPSGGQAGQVLKSNGADAGIWSDVDVTQTLAYNPDGTINTITTSLGTKTFSYNPDGTLAQIIGTGEYKTKTFAYTGGKLTGITVT
jgi:hypothetical protein